MRRGLSILLLGFVIGFALFVLEGGVEAQSACDLSQLCLSSASLSPALTANYSNGIDYATANGSGTTGSVQYINLKQNFLGGHNCALALITYNASFTLASPALTDNESETWTLAELETSGGFDVALYYVLGDTAGTNLLKFSTTSTTEYPSYFGATVTEVQNCNTSAIGGIGKSDSSSGATSITLSAAPSSGDMTYEGCVQTYVGAANTHKMTAIAANTGYHLLSAAISYGKGAQYSISNTSTSVSFTTWSGTSGHTDCAAAVIKQGPAGTAPPATKYIDHYQVEQVNASYAVDFPCGGNGIVGLETSGATYMSSVTGSSGTWSAPAGLLETSGNIGQAFYAYAVTCSSTLTVTPTWHSTPALGNGTIFELISITNANNTSSFYDSSGSTTCTGSGSSDTNLTTCTTTPSATGEFTFNVVAINRHTLQTMAADSNSHTPTPLMALNITNDDSGDTCSGTLLGVTPSATLASTLDEDNGYAFYDNTSDTLAITFIYTGTQLICYSGSPDGVGGWGSATIAVK